MEVIEGFESRLQMGAALGLVRPMTRACAVRFS